MLNGELYLHISDVNLSAYNMKDKLSSEMCVNIMENVYSPDIFTSSADWSITPLALDHFFFSLISFEANSECFQQLYFWFKYDLGQKY